MRNVTPTFDRFLSRQRITDIVEVKMSEESRTNDGTQLYVGNLSYDTNERDLEDYFGKIGRVSKVNLVQDR